MRAAGTRFHAVDMATGATRWSVDLVGDVSYSSPALSGDGVLYVATMGGYVYAIRSDASGLLPNAGWDYYQRLRLPGWLWTVQLDLDVDLGRART